MKLNHFGKLVKTNGKLSYIKDSQKKGFEEFTKNLGEGSMVEVFMEETDSDGSLPQLALAHVLLKDLSFSSGNSVEDIKLYVKDKVGLCVKRTIKGKEFLTCKSLGDCSKEELTLFIEGCKNMVEKI